MTSTELDYIASLEGDYRQLAVLQAVEGQLIRNGLLKESQILKAEINSLGALISAQEVKAYNDKQAWADKYGNYRYGTINKVHDKLKAAVSNEPIPWEEFDCVKCNDTGWLANYNTIGPKGKVPCSCEKGQEKTKKTDYMGPVTPIPTKPKPNPYGEAEKKQKAALAALEKKIAAEEAKLADIQTATGIAMVTQMIAQGPPELPRKGRKFR